MRYMLNTLRITLLALFTALFGIALVNTPRMAYAALADDGVVRVKSLYGVEETIARVKADVAAKGITFFFEIDQQKLAADANIPLRRSTLLVFGNPALGTQFLTSNPNAGLDWPVRLVQQDQQGQVWLAYTDFAYIARRHNITDRDAAFTMASNVIASIVSSAAPATN
jgi:uncharacterized protein (DUF302 family)